MTRPPDCVPHNQSVYEAACITRGPQSKCDSKLVARLLVSRMDGDGVNPRKAPKVTGDATPPTHETSPVLDEPIR